MDIDAIVTKLLEVQNKDRIKRHENLANRLLRAEQFDEHYRNATERRFRNSAERVLKALEKYEPNRLKFWLLYDTWSVEEGLILLCGFDPKDTVINSFIENNNQRYTHSFTTVKATRLDNISVSDEVFHAIVGDPAVWQEIRFLANKYLHLQKFWNSGDHSGERFSPSYFVSWAARKCIQIEWLEWAYAKGYTDIIGPPERNLKDLIIPYEKPLSTTERNTLLTIIAALCKSLNIDVNESGVASRIEALTEKIGARVTDDTIRTMLKKIPAALEARTK